MTEDQFEKQLIDYLSTGKVSQSIEVSKFNEKDLKKDSKDYVHHSELWKYEKDIKTTEQLWNNFKQILEQHNRDVLRNPLSVVEFNQVKKIISDLQTPYEAGQFLYGFNGVSQIEVDLDDGRHVFLKVFEQSEVGAGDTVYQVVNQIERPAVIAGKKSRRFDTTLLINGLPIIQIEEKRGDVDVDDALNQMQQYAYENQYRDIFSTLQILVAITPTSIKYMANTPADKFNKDFAFHWQRKSDNSVVHDWKEFAYSMLSIPMAHQMATNYMILDGTKNRQMLKVMRPYQVYATQNVLEAIKEKTFSDDALNKIGYVWHTTGSGKTITSFKTAWLASRMPGIDKVVFVADRIALTKQTIESYKAYDPDGNLDGVQDTDNTSELNRRLKSKGNGIIVTSVQKLNTLVHRKNFKAPHKRILFIVDEAHRSTGGESFKEIQKAFPNSFWVGYTGTPMFDKYSSGTSTKEIFGELLHAYTIREAISDQNVLGFKVDFETTIDQEQMKKDYLPQFYRETHPEWSDEQIAKKINNLNEKDMDDSISPSFYDENPDHVHLVVQDIFDNWRNRSNEGKYNALFTTHIGGNRTSTPMALMYFNEFQRVNELHKRTNDLQLKVAVTFSLDTSNGNNMIKANNGLHEAIKVYNKQFQTNFGLNDVSAYNQDVASRLNKTASDGQYLDIVIVIERLLTGFDAPELNTLYVDRTLNGANLIQAYSRTNRISNMQEKPWGRIVNYRWPWQNEHLMNKALAIYSHKESAETQLSDEELREQNISEGLTAPSFGKMFEIVKSKVDKLQSLTNDFVELPRSEGQKVLMYDLLDEYSREMAKLKQYTKNSKGDGASGFNYDEPNVLLHSLGMTAEQEEMLTVTLANELKEYIAKEKNIPFSQVDLKMTHVKEVKVNYDYLTELLNDLFNQVHRNEYKEAKETDRKIRQFANGLENRRYAKEIIQTAAMVLAGELTAENLELDYPIKLNSSDSAISYASNITVDRKILDFRVKWGIADVISGQKMKALFSHHLNGAQDLDDTGELRDILAKATDDYKTLAHDPEVQALPKIRYRINLSDAIYALADDLVQD